MIVALAGRRIDAPGAQAARFPPALAGQVKQRLIKYLSSVNAKHVISSGACGADLLALQAADELGIRKTMILPFDAATFKSTSVNDRPGDWGLIYDTLVTQLKQSDELIELQQSKEDPDVYLKTNVTILDYAQKAATKISQQQNNGDPSHGKITALIVWEGKPKDAGDTTYHFMQEAKKRNFPVKEISSNE